MLLEIYIDNFVLIENLRISFNPGLNVLTGETGAGKSIIVDALGLVAGDRLKSDLIRDEEKKAVVEAVFDISNSPDLVQLLEAKGLIEDIEDPLILSREIIPSGRSLARVNGRTINIGSLKELSSFLLDMHLQHDHLTILKTENYLDYIDNFAHEIEKPLEAAHDLYEQMHLISKQLTDLKADESSKLQRIDFLKYQINEIEMADLTIGEDEELSQLAERVRNAKHLALTATTILENLYAREQGLSAYDQISCAIDAINSTDDEILKSFLPNLENMYYTLQDISHEVSRYRSGLDFEPDLLDEIEDRLYMINQLKSKYGADIKEILAYYEQAVRELELLENRTTREKELAKELENLKQEYMKVAKKLTAKRKKASVNLQEIVNAELSALNMPHLQFAVQVEPRNTPTPKGIDKVEFLFSPNPGEPLKPLSRIASGGEISRFILALKIALTEVYNIPTFIFDEIDVGVGGTSLSAMAKKLGELSDSRQVILVTHSPQVASYANNHLLIEKYVADRQTYTTVKTLNDQDKTKELARMLGGESYTDITLKHAKEMLEKARLDR